MLMPLCPVCLAPVCATSPEVPTVRVHPDGVGKTCKMSGQPLPEWDEKSTRLAVHGRSGGICEYCLSRRATDMHHRVSRGVGGKWHPANIVHLCRFCHGDATNMPAWAYNNGICLRRTQDPGGVPMIQRSGELLYLTDAVTA